MMMTSLKDLKNFFEDVKKDFGLNIEVEEVDKEMKVTFHGVEVFRYEILYPEGNSTAYILEVNTGDSNVWVDIGGRGSVWVTKYLTEDEPIEKSIHVDSGVSIKRASFYKDKFSIIYVGDED